MGFAPCAVVLVQPTQTNDSATSRARIIEEIVRRMEFTYLQEIDRPRAWRTDISSEF